MEIIRLAFGAIRANKLRSILTLLGVVIGVFSIIGVMTAVDVLQNSIESGFSQLGANTFQIQKRPVMATRAERIAARNRKDITLDEARAVKNKIRNAEHVGIEVSRWGRVIKAISTGEETDPRVRLLGENPAGLITNNWTIALGRGINEDDVRSASNVVILGKDVVEKIFQYGDPIGEDVKISGKRYTVIGTFEPRGSMLGGSNDWFAVVPLTSFLNDFGSRRSMNIMVKAKNPEVYDDALEEARFILRTARKVDPGSEDDFSIFSNDSMIEQFNDFTQYVRLGVAFISFISLLAAGVGIMNIMLVSVAERIKEIGIRKAIGARKRNILIQFLTEAIVLCQIGGVIGIMLGVLAGNLVAILLDIPAIFPLDWATFAVILCTVIGVVFGVYPAWKAANLDPIEALRYE